MSRVTHTATDGRLHWLTLLSLFRQNLSQAIQQQGHRQLEHQQQPKQRCRLSRKLCAVMWQHRPLDSVSYWPAWLQTLLNTQSSVRSRCFYTITTKRNVPGFAIQYERSSWLSSGSMHFSSFPSSGASVLSKNPLILSGTSAWFWGRKSKPLTNCVTAAVTPTTAKAAYREAATATTEVAEGEALTAADAEYQGKQTPRSSAVRRLSGCAPSDTADTVHIFKLAIAEIMVGPQSRQKSPFSPTRASSTGLSRRPTSAARAAPIQRTLSCFSDGKMFVQYKSRRDLSTDSNEKRANSSDNGIDDASAKSNSSSYDSNDRQEFIAVLERQSVNSPSQSEGSRAVLCNAQAVQAQYSANSTHGSAFMNYGEPSKAALCQNAPLLRESPHMAGALSRIRVEDGEELIRQQLLQPSSGSLQSYTAPEVPLFIRDRYGPPKDPSTLLIEPHRLTMEERIFQKVFVTIPVIAFLLMLATPVTLVRFHVKKLKERQKYTREVGEELGRETKPALFRFCDFGALREIIEQPANAFICYFHPHAIASQVLLPLLRDISMLFERLGIQMTLALVDLTEKSIPHSVKNLFPADTSPHGELLLPFALKGKEPALLLYDGPWEAESILKAIASEVPAAAAALPAAKALNDSADLLSDCLFALHFVDDRPGDQQAATTADGSTSEVTTTESKSKTSAAAAAAAARLIEQQAYEASIAEGGLQHALCRCEAAREQLRQLVKLDHQRWQH